MAAAPPPRLLLLVVLLLVPVSNAIYCEEDDCYDLLGYSHLLPPTISSVSWFVPPAHESMLPSRVKQDANVSEIKKAYYKLSLKQ
jgi:DnaJ family protein C protein 25